MSNKNNPTGSKNPFSFVKNKIFKTISRETPNEDLISQLEESKTTVKNLQLQKEALQSKWLLITRNFGNIASIEPELEKINTEKKALTAEISSEEKNIQTFYATKDIRNKELDQAKSDLKKILGEKRDVQSDTTLLREQEREMEGLKEDLSRFKAQEDEANNELEEIEVRIRFANANIETLVIDLTTAEKTLGDLEETIKTKRRGIKSSEDSKSAIDQVLSELDALKSIKSDSGPSFQAFKAGADKLRAVRESIRKVEDEHNSIPKKIAEMNTAGGKNKEKAALIEKLKLSTLDIGRLKEEERNIVKDTEKNKSTLEKVEKASLKLKRIMISTGLNDLVERVDTTSLETLKTDILNKFNDTDHSIGAQRNKLAQAETIHSQKQTALLKMREELNRLKTSAQQDKNDVEQQREGLKKIRNKSATTRSGLEEKLKEKSSTMSEAIKVNMELKRAESLATDAVGLVNRLEKDVNSMDDRESKLLLKLRTKRAQIEDLEDLEKYFEARQIELKNLNQLKHIEQEFSLAQEVAAKYATNLRGLKGIEKEKLIFEKKLALVEEKGVSMEDLTSRLSGLETEKDGLEKTLAPLRSEIDFAIEKRDNVEMEISFARESLKVAKERMKSLERKLEFITQESGSVKGIQEKLTACENKLAAAERNMAEIQTRLDFTAATEDVVDENFKISQKSLASVDSQIEALAGQVEEKETFLLKLQEKMSNCEKKLGNEKNSKIELETNQAAFSLDIKKIAVERTTLSENIKTIDKEFNELREEESVIEKTTEPYNANLEKQKKLDKKIENLSSELDKGETQVDNWKKQISDLQLKKRELMDESIGSPALKGADSPSEDVTEKADEEVNPDKEQMDTLKKERKSIRGQIKEVDAKIEEVKNQTAGDKEKIHAEVDALRNKREGLHKKVDDVNKKLDALKENSGKPEKANIKVDDKKSKDKDDGISKGIVQAIGELDIEGLTLTKNIEKVMPDIEKKKTDLAELLQNKNDLILEIEKQKKIISPLESIKRQIASLSSKKESDTKSLTDRTAQKEILAKKTQEAKEEMEIITGNIETGKEEFTQSESELKTKEGDISECNMKLNMLMENKGRVLSEYHRLKTEMDSIIKSTGEDKKMVGDEKLMAESARKEVEEMKKQLAEAMTILTGKAGSVDGLKLELVSSTSEVSDTKDRISAQELDLKSAAAAVDGIESSMEPLLSRFKYITWAQKIITKNLKNLGLSAQLEKMKGELEELQDAKELFDKYQDLSKTKEEMEDRVEELNSYFELETKLVTSEQARQEATLQVNEKNEKIESQESAIKNLEEKYKSATEERINIKEMLDDAKRQLEVATIRWGKIEDLSRIEDSLEFKIREFQDKFGAMERISLKIKRLEEEREELHGHVSTLKNTCRTLEEGNEFLETSLAKTKADFKEALLMVKKTGDEAKRFLYSET